MQLDEVIPQWQFRERHAIALGAPVAAVMSAIDGVTWREVPLFRVLMLVRSLRGATLNPDHPVLDGMRGLGFTILRQADDEVVFGLVVAAAVTAVPRSSTAGDLAHPPYGHVAVAGNFRYDGATLSTETRVNAADARSRRRFRLYWLLIRLPSGLIRREWLKAIAARATGPYLPPPAVS